MGRILLKSLEFKGVQYHLCHFPDPEFDYTNLQIVRGDWTVFSPDMIYTSSLSEGVRDQFFGGDTAAYVQSKLNEINTKLKDLLGGGGVVKKFLDELEVVLAKLIIAIDATLEVPQVRIGS